MQTYSIKYMSNDRTHSLIHLRSNMSQDGLTYLADGYVSIECNESSKI